MSNNYYNKKLKGFARAMRKNSTQAEIKLWCELLRNKQMMGYTFLRQRPIGPYIADFFCKSLGLVIETDGISHQYPDVIRRDSEKTDYLRNHGFRVLRFSDEEVMDNIDQVKEQIEKWITHHPPTPFEGGR
jgi:very-short-patch-repair endonuclease